jgi:hypothetical protein
LKLGSRQGWPTVRVCFLLLIPPLVYPEVRVCPSLWFVFPIGLVRLMTVRYLCHSILTPLLLCLFFSVGGPLLSFVFPLKMRYFYTILTFF